MGDEGPHAEFGGARLGLSVAVAGMLEVRSSARHHFAKEAKRPSLATAFLVFARKPQGTLGKSDSFRPATDCEIYLAQRPHAEALTAHQGHGVSPGHRLLK